MKSYIPKNSINTPLKKNEKVHHINMDKEEYNKENLWVCSNKTHTEAHNSLNELCKELMNNYNKYSGIDFSKDTGKYYLKEV